jgi:hypothetical protein
MDAETHVSSPVTDVELPVRVSICTPVKLAKANAPVVGTSFGHLVVTTKFALTDHTVKAPVMVSLYPVLESITICKASPLFITQVYHVVFPLILRYPEAVAGEKESIPVAVVLITPAVYTLEVVNVFNCAAQLHQKLIHSNTVSRIAKTSAIYLLESNCERVKTGVLMPVSYLMGFSCLSMSNPNA